MKQIKSLVEKVESFSRNWVPGASEYIDKRFLRKVKEYFQISLIYYPGAWWVDRTLESAFKPEEIVYLDIRYGSLPKAFQGLGFNYISADYGKSPFKDNVFDALFFQNPRASEDEAIEMLRTLRPGGIVIHSSFNGRLNLSSEQFERLPGITKIDSPFPYCNIYTLFRKDADTAPTL
jgi:hypothetical protein